MVWILIDQWFIFKFSKLAHEMSDGWGKSIEIGKKLIRIIEDSGNEIKIKDDNFIFKEHDNPTN